MGTWDKRHTLIVVTGLLNFLVLVCTPALVEPPRLALQQPAVITSAIIGSFPLFWSFCLILFGRSRFAKVLAFVNLSLAGVCVIASVCMIAKAF